MNNHIQRRLFLKGVMATACVSVAMAAGVLTPTTVLANWPESAFKSKKIPEALNNVFGSDSVSDSDRITVKSPDIAENGAVVPMTVTTDLENIEMIALFASKNAMPLTATYEFSPTMRGYISTRMKVAESSDLVAVIKSNGKLYTAKKPIKVTLGGCGG